VGVGCSIEAMPQPTTLTLDDDVAQQLDEAARRSGQPVEAVANEALRRGLTAIPVSGSPLPFRVIPRSLGLRPGLSLNCIEDMLERLEGPARR
jgi:hypothetical protein